MRRGGALARAMVAALALSATPAGLLGCDGLQAPEADDETPRGPDDPRALQALFERVVDAARKQDGPGIISALEPFLLTREELAGIFGPEVGAAVWPGYSDQVAGSLRAEAAAVILQRVADGYTEVRVDRVGPAYPARTTPGDQRLLDAFVPRGLAMYSVWLRKPGDTLGLRFNGFIYHGGRWRALLKAYEHLPAAAATDDAPADEAPTDEAPGSPPAPGGAPGGEAEPAEGPAPSPGDGLQEPPAAPPAGDGADGADDPP